MKTLRIFGMLFALLSLALLPLHASAQIIDDMVLNTVKGKVVVTIRFAGRVQYLRHFPATQGQTLEIYYNILSNEATRDQWQGYEARTSPPSSLIPSFTVTAEDQNTQPKLVVKFSRPANFSVRGGANDRTILIIIQPEKEQPGEPEGLPELPEIEQGEPGAAAPTGSTADSNRQATTLMTQGRDALLLFDYPAAIEAFNKVLLLPPNKYTADALEWIGVASQKSGQVDKARSTYQQYLVRNPSGAGAARVRQRLAGLTVAPTAHAAQIPTPHPTQEAPSAVSLPPPVAAPAPQPGQLGGVDQQAAGLMTNGQDALQRDDYGGAIEAFNKLLLLPPNAYTQDAQEWVGVARERAGQKFKAKLEYELYLKTYTKGPGVKRVKKRLAELSASPAVAQAPALAPAEQPKEKKGFQTVTYGNLSMYYYHGASQTDTLSVVGNVPTQSSLTIVDQSLLLTNVSLGLRARSDVYDNRLVFQDSYSQNFLPGKPSNNRLNAAYFDVKNKVADYSGRFGRQSPLGGGVVGRFDGATVGYGFLPKWHINGVAGQLADLSIGPKPIFYGTSLDMGTFNEHWGSSIYLINQTVEGNTDRRAAGAELRYFDPNKNAFGTLDYDSNFAVVNTAMLQGSIIASPRTTYNFLLDHRRTPSISLRNSLTGATVASVRSLQQAGFTMVDIKALARARTAVANLAQIGATHQIQEKWMLGGDIRVSSTSGMPASGTLNPNGTTGIEGFQPATPSTGNQWTLTSQLIGNSIFSARDVSVFSLGYTKSNLLKGVTALVSNHSIMREKWSIDPSLRLYAQKDNQGGRETILTPNLKLAYQAKERLALETEVGLELTNNLPATGPTSKTTRKYFSFGFRGDF